MNVFDRPWGVSFDLYYDDGAYRWTQYYRTKTGANLSRWWKVNISSWGGFAKVFNNRKQE